jgi:2-polyprenyl-6-methoxyphenol hydroxylase-like FAD-dependent oxidoreductase
VFVVRAILSIFSDEELAGGISVTLDYHFGMSLERIVQETGRVTAVFADGSRASGELLVGADGIRSTVREQLFPEVLMREIGSMAVDLRRLSAEECAGR